MYVNSHSFSRNEKQTKRNCLQFKINTPLCVTILLECIRPMQKLVSIFILFYKIWQVEPRGNTGFWQTNTTETEAVLWDLVFPALDKSRIQSNRTLLPDGRVQSLSVSHLTQTVFKWQRGGKGGNKSIKFLDFVCHLQARAIQLHMPSTKSTHRYSQGYTAISNVHKDRQLSAVFI